MSQWETVAVREVADVFDGPHATPGKTDEGPWYLSISSLNNGRFDFVQSAHLSEADLPRWTKRVAPRSGDTLFSYETRLGEAAYWEHNVEAALGRRMGLLRPKAGKVEPRYLSYAYLGPQFQEVIRQKTLHGATVDRIPVGDMPSWPLLLPSLDDQRAIVGILGSIDRLIENNWRRVEVLEEMARVIYREWFVRFRYPGHENVEMVDSALGPIPDGWAREPLGSLAELDRSGIQPVKTPDEIFDHFSIPAFDAGHHPAQDAGSAIMSGKFLVGTPAVLVSKLNPRIERTWLVGALSTRRAVASTEFLVLRPKDGLTLEWLYLTTRSDAFRQRLIELSGGTSTSHQRAKPNDFLAISVVRPSASIAARFAEHVVPMLKIAQILRDEARVLGGLRDRLLPRLVTGQIDVSSLKLDALVEGAVA